jgi:CBS-domain-containing membrane protein
MHTTDLTSIPTAAELMNPAVHALSADEQLIDAAQNLLAHGYSCAPVVEGERVVGVLSERDAIREYAAVAFHGARGGVVRDAMSEAVTVAPSDGLFQLVDHFTQRDVRRVFVIAEDGRMLGLITRSDVLRRLEAMRAERERAPHASTYDKIAAQHAKDMTE